MGLGSRSEIEYPNSCHAESTVLNIGDFTGKPNEVKSKAMGDGIGCQKTLTLYE